MLKNENSVYCEKCKTKTNTKKSLSLEISKNTYTTFKRYTQQSDGSYSRNNCTVDFSPELMFREKTGNKK